jgi:hypothetical protein
MHSSAIAADSTSRDGCATIAFVTDRSFLIGLPVNGRASLTRLPDGLELEASGWDQVWAACPEFGVKFTAVSFESDEARAKIIAAWGVHADMP